MSAPDTSSLEQGLNSLGATSMPSPAPSDEWQRRHAGLQSTMTRVLETTGWGKLDAIPRRSDVEALQQKANLLPDLQSQFETLQTEKAALASERDKLAADKAALELETRKTRLLAEKAPDLFPFLRYIPTVGDETGQLSEFDAFRATLGTAAQPASAGRPLLPNQPASQPPANAPVSAANLYPQMLEALQKGDMDTYNRLKAEWHKAPLSE